MGRSMRNNQQGISAGVLLLVIGALLILLAGVFFVTMESEEEGKHGALEGSSRMLRISA